MKRLFCSAVLLFAAALAISCTQRIAVEEILAEMPIDSADEIITKSGVAIDSEVTTDGNGSARIESNGRVTVRIAEVEGVAVEDARLIYRARLRTQDLEGKAYLEMWCAFPGQGEFFSRALHDPLSGTTDWVSQETPFFLEKGQKPSRVKLNLVIEGAGTVWLDEVTLAKAGR